MFVVVVTSSLILSVFMMTTPVIALALETLMAVMRIRATMKVRRKVMRMVM